MRASFIPRPPPPADAAERIGTLLERYETVQVQRVDEIAAYAQTHRCRHGHINAYLGGRAIERCTACDNCVDSPNPAQDDLDGDGHFAYLDTEDALGMAIELIEVPKKRVAPDKVFPPPQDQEGEA